MSPSIVFIDPPGWQGAANGQVPFPNVGIAYLVPALLAAGWEVRVIDLNNEARTGDSLVAELQREPGDIVAFSVKSATWLDSLSLIRRIRSDIPGARLIAGGPHATVGFAQMWQSGLLDAVVMGEGELVLPELCNCLRRGEREIDLPGVVTAATVEVMDFRRSKAPSVVPDLDTLAFPDYDLFPAAVRQGLAGAYPLVTSRGCVYNCNYCSVPLISGRSYRKRRPECLLAELSRARARYNSLRFEIIDDSFNLDVKRCKEFCRQLIGSEQAWTWSCPNGLRADGMDAELAGLMRQSGCDKVMVGVESGAPEVFNSIGKGETLAEIERGIKLLQDAGIAVGGYFIIGLPGDSRKAELASVEFAKRLKIRAHFNMLVPYPGTALWDWVGEHGRWLAHVQGNCRHFADDAGKLSLSFDTEDFPARQRVQAFEMVNTKLRQFEFVIPAGVSRYRRYLRIVRLLWAYDRGGIPASLWGWLRRKIRRGNSRNPEVAE